MSRNPFDQLIRLFKVFSLTLFIFIVPVLAVLGSLGFLIAYPKVGAILMISVVITLCLFGAYFIADDFLRSRDK